MGAAVGVGRGGGEGMGEGVDWWRGELNFKAELFLAWQLGYHATQVGFLLRSQSVL